MSDIPGLSPFSELRRVISTVEEIRKRLLTLEGGGSTTTTTTGSVAPPQISLTTRVISLAPNTTATTVTATEVTTLTALLMTPLSQPAATPDWYLSTRVAGSHLVLTHGTASVTRHYQAIIFNAEGTTLSTVTAQNVFTNHFTHHFHEFPG